MGQPAVDVGCVEPECDILRSGSRRRAVLAADAATCDLHVFGADGQLRVFSPKAASAELVCIRRLSPMVLDATMACSIPEFWRDPPSLRREAEERAEHGLPFEPLEIALSQTGEFVALAGIDQVAVVSVPRGSPTVASPPVGEVTNLLSSLGLGQYADAFALKGYTTIAPLPPPPP